MIKIEDLHPLLQSIAIHPEGISSYYLAQEMGLPEQKLRPRLLKCVEDRLLRKEKSKFFLTGNVFINNGFGIFYEKKHKRFTFVGCPYYLDHTCPCSKTGEIDEKISHQRRIKGHYPRSVYPR